VTSVVLTLPSRRAIYAEDHLAFRESTARFVADMVTPNLASWRTAGGVPREVVAAAGEAGFLGTAVSEEYGGGGTDDLGFLAVLIEETAAVGATALSVMWAVQAGVAIPVLTAGDHTRWLPALTGGELIATVASATDGALTLANGRISGELAGVCSARTADLLLVDLGDSDVAVVEIDQSGVTITPRAPALGGAEAGIADLKLAGVTGDVIQAPLTRQLDIWFAVVALATARAALALGVEYARTRKVFGRPLAEFENTRFRLAELSAALATTTTYVDYCLSTAGALATEDAAAARFSASRVLDEVVDQSLQLHGGYGYMREYPISTAFADARFLRLAAQRFSDPRTALAVHLGL
jgi:alkylation response protein AidB-like acyl-CoA dehydrogenase